MKRYALSNIVGGHYKLSFLKQFIKPLVDVKSLGKTQGNKSQKFYTLEELKIIRNTYLKRVETMKIKHYAQCEREDIFLKLETFLKELGCLK